MKKITLTRDQVELAAKFGLSAKEYARGLIHARKYEQLLRRPPNKCEKRFHEWVSKTYSELPEGQDFPAPDEFMYEVWQAAWRSAYSTGLARGQNQMAARWHMAEDKKRIPMPYTTMADLFEGCETGRQYGLRIEKWHGIE